MRRLDIGVASYLNPQKLVTALESIESKSTTDWRCFIIHNPAPGDELTKEMICGAVARNPRFVPVWLSENVGYAGAVNELLRRAETEYIAYCDNDTQVITPGWDETFCSILDRFHEVGMVFPASGAYPIDRGNYTEVMWGVGFCWALNRMTASAIGPFDDSLGHQEEADYCLRVRMAGWRCAAIPTVQVLHYASASNDPKAIERINSGVVNWVNKWVRYFAGESFDYYSPNVIRWEDWPPNALYLEEFWKIRQPDLNAAPETVLLDGRMYDLIRVPRLAGFYRNRII